MIIATMFGGPRDGLEVAVQDLTPLVFPVTSGSVVDWLSAGPDENVPPPTFSMVTYVPRRDTLALCACCPNWAHPVLRPELDLSAITYQQHHTCTYYVSGWGR